MLTKPIGIFGGTFDPIHTGHLELAKAVYLQAHLAAVYFIPCFQSPFKDLPHANIEQRLTMLKLAITNFRHFYIDQREIERGGVSYTIETLQSLRQEYPKTPLCLMMSIETFANFNLWYKWQEIMQLAHIIVVNRFTSYQQNITTEIIDLLKTNQIYTSNDLVTKLAGTIFLIEMSPQDISATQIRTNLKNGRDVSNLLPDTVLKFIRQENLYI